MRSLSRFKLLGLAAVLVALLTAVGGLVISQAAGGGSGIQATVNKDAVRFAVQNEKVAVLRAEVFNLSGKRLYDSGPVMGNALDWNMSTEAGERAAHGVYLYVITAWDSRGELVKSQVGKLALVPGGGGLGQAPALGSRHETGEPRLGLESQDKVRALANYNEDVTINGNLAVHGGIEGGAFLSGLASAAYRISSNTNQQTFFVTGRNHPTNAPVLFTTDTFGVYIGTSSTSHSHYILRALNNVANIDIGSGGNEVFWVGADGKIGIGTSDPAATLEVHGTATNLLALYDPADPGSPKFKIQKDGDVYADRSYNCGLASGCFNAGTGADVAERINTSEQVGPGDVVEIDPEHPRLYRKAQRAYSTKVAGVISTAPAITLGNNFDPETDLWEDSRPLLALAGRVPVKATTENGPIEIGDFLTTSSTPGYAMRCGDLSRCTGAILGKALESLDKETGVIMAQVTLR